MQNKISIVIPIYNSAEFLNRCLDSVISQTLKGIEIILVDDGSTDSSSIICEEYANKYENIKLIHQEKAGQIAARKRGVEEAETDWVGFVDSDDYIEPEMYKELYQVCQKYNCELISSGIVKEYHDGKNNEIIYDNFSEGLYGDLAKDIYPSMIYDFKKNDFGLYCNVVNKLFKKDIIKKVLSEINENIVYGEDAAMVYSYCLECKSIYILGKAFYHYCIRKGSMCSFQGEKLILNSFGLYNYLKEKFTDSPQKHVLMHQLKRYVLDLEAHTLEFMYGIKHGILNKWCFSYEGYLFEKKFIIYGASACGQALYHQVRRNHKENNLVAWVDRNHVEMSDLCDYDIDAVETGLKKKHDIVIIAVKDIHLADTIRKDLVEKYKEAENNIVWREIQEESFFSEALY